MQRLIGQIVIAVIFIFAQGEASAVSPRTFDLPDHGTLSLSVPDGWEERLSQPPDRLPPTISLTPRSGQNFQILITVVWAVGPGGETPDGATLRADVAAAARDTAPHSVEGTLPLRELAGSTGKGYYFVATDPAPKPGEYKYLAQGMIRTGQIALAFTILTNDGQDAVLKAALALLQTASQSGPGALSQPHGGTREP